MSSSTDSDLTGTGNSSGPRSRGHAACNYCGGTAETGITETVVVGHGPFFSRVVAACPLCAGLRVQGLRHDASWGLVEEPAP